MLIYAHNPETGETAIKPVVQTFRNEASELVHITVDGEEIICTNEHPFYSPVKGWTAACKLRTGDILVTVNGEYVVVDQIQHELLESPVTVYNFEVKGFHTYFVGDTEVLVHNDCGENGKYEKAPYHNKGNAIKSPAPIDGQKALNNSIQIKSTSPTRVGISNGQIVMLPQTSPGVYHGYVVAWNELSQAAKNALYKAGMTDLKGNIFG